jgi:hypothetical protein
MEAKDMKHFVERAKSDNRRINLQHKTYFSLEERNRVWEQCTIININKNLKGIAVQFHTDREIRVNAIVTIDLSTPEECRPACIKGVIRWIKQTERGFTGGIELTNGNSKLKRVLPCE